MHFAERTKVSDHEVEDHGSDLPDTGKVRGSYVSPWGLEAASLLASMACIIAIMVLLRVQDNKPIPEWGPITLNGIVSVLSDLAHAALLYPVSEAIGQLKWHWFASNKPRRMDDMDVYNFATRGPYGSLWLLFKPRLWNLSSLGAFLTVAALAMQFFLQLMPTYRQQPVQSGEIAHLGQAINFTDYIESTDPLNPGTLTTDAMAALTSALYGTQDQVKADCKTGNCTWPSYQSLGACAVCLDVRDQLKKGRDPYYNFPSWSYAGSDYTAWYWLWQGDTGRGIPNLANFTISRSFVLWYDEPNKKAAWNARPNAIDCIIHYCVKTYNTTVVNGQLNETVIDTWPTSATPTEELSSRFSKQLMEVPGMPKRQNFTVIRSPSADFASYIYSWSTYALKAWYDDLMSTMVQYTWGSDGVSGAAMIQIRSIREHHSPLPLLEQAAAGLTVHLRNQALSNGSTVGLVTGETFQMKTFVQVRWEWAILPLVLLLLALIFVITTAIASASRDLPVWKNSSLPSIVYQLESETTAVIAEYGPLLTNLEREAKKHGITMNFDDGCWKFSSQSTVDLTTPETKALHLPKAKKFFGFPKKNENNSHDEVN